MGIGGLGDAVAVGLLAGGEDFERLRRATRQGRLRGLWAAFLRRVTDKQASAGERALAAAVERRLDWAEPIVAEVTEWCRKPFWCNHEAGVMSLGAMDLAREMALVVDWLWPILGRDSREALIGAIIARTIENTSRAPDGVRDEDGRGQMLIVRRIDKDDPRCFHPLPHQANNWDLWFSGVLYMAAMLAERAWITPAAGEPKLEWGHYYDVGYTLDAARIARWKGIARERIQTAMDNVMSPDGVYREGISYAGYGGTALMLCLNLLSRHEGRNLFTGGVTRMPQWIHAMRPGDAAPGQFNFNDAKLTGVIPTGILLQIASHTNDPEHWALAMDALDSDRQTPQLLDMLAYREQSAAPVPAMPSAAHYPEGGMVIWRSEASDGTIAFALQSGRHGGAHQHRDRNSFFLAAHGDRLIVDSGDGRHIAGSASNPTHDSTFAHNCVLIDGAEQFIDPAKPPHGEILEHADTGAMQTLLAEAGACYRGIRSCRRRVVFARPDVFVLCDRVDGPCNELTWLLQGYNGDHLARWDVSGNMAVLRRAEADLHVFFATAPVRQAVGTGTLDGEHNGILRLESVFAGKGVNAILVPCRKGTVPPRLERSTDGRICVHAGGRVVAVTFAPEMVTVDGRGFVC